ncbi:unnamed protein product [Gulo gulo]|uniref:Uncharacterized protein n=1 Tax=Gulo gulo TaxID=48420 RepID=A0A9X9Q5Q0_GULGU|nr:unnamed protein product [Gulo gulo]
MRLTSNGSYACNHKILEHPEGRK